MTTQVFWLTVLADASGYDRLPGVAEPVIKAEAFAPGPPGIGKSPYNRYVVTFSVNFGIRSWRFP